MSFTARRLFSAVAFLSTCLAASAQAQSPALKSAWEQFQARSPGWQAEWSEAGDQAQGLRGLSPVSADDPVAIAKSFAARNATLLGVAGGANALKLARRVFDGSDTHVSLQQSIDGLPVFNGFLDIHMNGKGQIYLVHNNTVSPGSAAALARASVLPAGKILNAAQRRTYAKSDKSGNTTSVTLAPVGQPELGIERTDGRSRLVYRVDYGPFADILDATTGALLSTINYTQSVNGTGTVFDPNPVNTLTNTNLNDRADANYPALKGAYYTDKTLRSITKTGTGANARYTLSGPYARALDLKKANVGTCMNGETEIRKAPSASLNGKFAFNRSQSDFEHVMAYYHLDKSQRYIQSLGFTTNWNAAIRVDAHAFPEDNSFYCGRPVGSGYLAFGDGGVDDAEDADVVLHEYGHALQDNASGGRYLGGGQAGAMGEGFGDYWAYSARPFGRFAPCFAEWDGQGTCLRRLDKNKKYPKNYVGEVHADGEIWSRALYDLHGKVGKEVANKLILKSHFLVPASPTFSKGLQAVLDADHTLYADAHKNDICASFVERGISATDCGYWVQISWNKMDTDVDLHITPPAPLAEVYYGNRYPNWGDQTTTEDDPLLYEDCIHTCTTEKITVSSLPTPGTYRIHTYYYSDHGFGATTVSMDVYRGAKKLFSGSHTLSATGEDWAAFDIVIPNPKAKDGQEPQVVKVDQVRMLPPGPAKQD